MEEAKIMPEWLKDNAIGGGEASHNEHVLDQAKYF